MVDYSGGFLRGNLQYLWCHPAQVIGHAFNLITENIQIYGLFEGFERRSIIYDIFSTSLFYFGLLVLVLYLMRGLFLFFMRQTIILMSRHIELT
jgi:ATP-binding cassette subfamily B multidrug efflux pump